MGSNQMARRTKQERLLAASANDNAAPSTQNQVFSVGNYIFVLFTIMGRFDSPLSVEESFFATQASCCCAQDQCARQQWRRSGNERGAVPRRRNL